MTSDLPSINPLMVQRLGEALDPPFRPRRRAQPDIGSYTGKLVRVVNKAPEVVVKVSGTSKGAGKALAHLTYITRNGKLSAENERGERIAGREELKDAFGEWGITANNSSRERAHSVHLVVSMPEGTDHQAVLVGARGFAYDQFGRNHQYLMVLHTDTAHPHVHLAVRAQGFDLTWLKRSKSDLQEWRECFAQRMRDQGVEAEATPRRARGKSTKATSQAMYHLRKAPKKSTVITAKVDIAVREAVGNSQRVSHAWEEAAASRRQKVVTAYADIRENLAKCPETAQQKLSDKLAQFLGSMPPFELESRKLVRQAQRMVNAETRRSKSTARVGTNEHGPSEVDATEERTR